MTDEQSNAEQNTVVEPPSDNAEYYEALGRFVAAFSQAEMWLFYLYARLTRTPMNTARIVFAGMRTEQMLKHIKALWKADPPAPEVRADYMPVLQHLGAIATRRNHVVHWVTGINESGRVVTNFHRALPKNIQTLSVSPKLLDDMTSDLFYIGQHLVGMFSVPAETRAERVARLPALADAWRYKAEQYQPQSFQQSKPVRKNPRRR